MVYYFTSYLSGALSGSYRGSGTWRNKLLEKSTTSHPLRQGISWLEKWLGESVRDVGGIILAVAPAYPPFAAAYFRALCCTCKFSRESEVETQSSVRGLIFSPNGQHHQYNYMSYLSLSSEQGGWVLSRKLSN